MKPSSTLLTLAALLLTGLTGCSGADGAEDVGETQDELRVTSSFTARGTGYYPSSSTLEGGFNDRIGKRLKTLQQFLAGDATYVSVAMDTTAFKYGTRLRIRELDAKYGRAIVFRVVDTGGAFRGKGRSRIDVCVSNRSASVDRTINGTLHIDVIDETSGPPAPSDDSADSADPPASAPPSSAGGGARCGNDGACNPGNDGAGLICTAGTCVPGCRSNAQCPGSKTCQSGSCR